MTAEDEQQVLSREELSVGDEIEAWHNGKLFHRGEVIRTVADTDLFWILDERTGIRRLIDAEALVIRRMAVTAVKYGSVAEVASAGAGGVSGRPAAESLATVVPASHVPLFQAPSVVP
ncbi:MAG TPA: hypothetical protein VLR70_01930 [Arthrobacter sp.]|nr:hypothetical protein [Arthrobacter sp.]